MFMTSSDLDSSKSATLGRQPAAISLVAMMLLLAWDFSGADMKMAEIWGDATGFPLRDHWWMVKVMHEGARNLGWLFFLVLLIGV